MVYSIDANNHLIQHEYAITDDLNPNSIIASNTTGKISPRHVSFSNHCLDTGLNVATGSPLTVVGQDNTHLFNADTVPECSKSRLLTHLILYAVPDRSSLNLDVWNCSAGFINSTSQIQPLLKENSTYLALTSHQNGSIYVMYDQGNGPQIEEWKVPKVSGDPWNSVQNVTAKFNVHS
jgi:hypothetical protein